MAPRPAKRQKRAVVLSSDDEETSQGSKKQRAKNDVKRLPVPTRSKRQATSGSANEKPSNVKSPQSTQNAQPKTSTRKISSFFAAAGNVFEAQKRPSLPKEYRDAEPAASGIDEEEDVIEDVSENEQNHGPGATQFTTRSVLDRRKTKHDSDGRSLSSSRKSKFPSGSQKFMLRSNGTQVIGNGAEVNVVNQEPWIERFPPLNLEELAVHKKKVSDVQSWLENALSGRHRKRLLVLRGPAGAGKTTTLKMLAQVLHLDVSEWKNPMGSQYASEGYISMSAHFEDFLGRSGKFNTLDFDSISKKDNANLTVESSARKIVLIEEFPNIAISTSTALYSFRSSILQSLATPMPSLPLRTAGASPQATNLTPLILVITETRLTSTATLNDVFTAHRLLGSEILNHPAASVIEFNPVAPTFIRKALDLVVRKEAQCSGRRRTPGASALTKLCDIGDVRSAISSLEFLCVKAQDSDDWGGEVAARKQRGKNATSTLTKLERDSLETISLRENSIGLFHAVGKVVYNKREEPNLQSTEDCLDNAIVQPPDHLQEHVRLRHPETSVDKLIDETGTDADTFIAALHENYVMSCDCPTLVDALDGCLSALSDSDLLTTSRGLKSGHSGFAAATSEILRRDEIAFQLAVRGLLFALPYPVKRSTHPTRVPGRAGGKGDSYKMFYPASMRLWRQTEQLEDSIDRWIQHFRNTITSNTKRGRTDHGSFESGEPGRLGNDPDDQTLLTNHHQGQTDPIRTSLTCTKIELILERLPYITKIEQAQGSPTNLSGLESITQFHGIDIPQDDASEDEGVGLSMETAQANTKPAMQQLKKEADKGRMNSILPIEDDVEKLYLSEDDIED